MTYVVLIAFGAYEVAAGRMTTGALVACAIITGRVNGPLIAPLPNFIIQWGYARSSLIQLDGLLGLPQDHPAETADRKCVVSGKSVSVRLDSVGRRIMQINNHTELT